MSERGILKTVKIRSWPCLSGKSPGNLSRCAPFARAQSCGREQHRLVLYCRTTSASTAPCTSRRMCCLTHCASYCALCQPLLRAFSEWVRFPPCTEEAAPCTCSWCCWRRSGLHSNARSGQQQKNTTQLDHTSNSSTFRCANRN